jgi:hypothetical protein
MLHEEFKSFDHHFLFRHTDQQQGLELPDSGLDLCGSGRSRRTASTTSRCRCCDFFYIVTDAVFGIPTSS